MWFCVRVRLVVLKHQKILPTINMVMGRLVVPQHPNHGQQTWSVVSGKTKKLRNIDLCKFWTTKRGSELRKDNREWMKNRVDDWINGGFEKEGCCFSSSSCETWSGHWSSVQDPGPAELCNV